MSLEGKTHHFRFDKIDRNLANSDSNTQPSACGANALTLCTSCVYIYNSIVRNKSDFIPPKDRNNNLDKFVNAVINKSFSVEQFSRRTNFRKNLNKTEWDV